MHRDPTVIPVDQAGVPTDNDLVLVVREEEARYARPGPARLPAGADARRAGGPRAARRRPPPRCVAANPSLEPRLQLESIKQTLPAARARRSRQAVRLAEPRATGPRSRHGCSTNDLIAHNPANAGPVRRTRTSSCPGRASDAADRDPHRRRRLPWPERRHPRRSSAAGSSKRATPSSGFRHGWAGVLDNDCDRARPQSDLGDPARAAARSSAPRAPTPTPTAPTAARWSPAALERAGVDALIPIGGDDTLGVAQRLHEAGVPVWASPRRSTTTSAAPT